MILNKKLIIAVLSIFVILLTINFGLNFWIDKKLPKLLSENNATPYTIAYQNLEVDLWSTTIRANKILITPKENPKKSNEKLGIYTNIKNIVISEFSITDLLLRNVLSANSITINSPKIILYHNQKKQLDVIKQDVVAPFGKIIKVANIYLKKGSLDVVATATNKLIIQTKNINIILEDILINETSLKKKIPFEYQKYVITTDSILYQPNEFYKIQIEKLATLNKQIQVKNFELLPLVTRNEFVRKIKKEKDLFTVKADSISVNEINWGFQKEQFYFNAQSLVLNKVDANIYRNKLPTDDLSKKPLYSSLLRNLNFSMKIDSLSINNSKLVYEEEITFEKGPAVLTFDKFNLKANNIQSGFGLKKTDDLKIKIDCIFMKNSALNVDWKFNILDKSDSFNIKGTIANFDLNAMKSFTRPYLNASFNGKFKKYQFDIWGNDFNSKGNASLYYDDLNVTFYKKKEPHKKSKFKSTIANLVVKKDSDQQAKTTTMEVERIQEKSFYNFLWRNVAESLKKILI